MNPPCSCILEVENTLHFFMHCQHCSTFCMCLMNEVNQIVKNLLLYGDSRFDDNKNNFILSASMTYNLETERFLTSLFQSINFMKCINFYFSIIFILIFISSDTFHLVISFYFIQFFYLL